MTTKTTAKDTAPAGARQPRKRSRGAKATPETAAATSAKATATPAEATAITLEALASMTAAELEACYRAGKVPESLATLDGPVVGRLLALPKPVDHGPVAAAVRKLASWQGFPWRGQTFTSADATHGSGVNRFRVIGDHEWVRFETRIAPSAVDGQPCIVLDYDQDANPWPMRQLRDELREVGPDLYVGPALVTAGKTPRVVLHFAVQHATA